METKYILSVLILFSVNFIFIETAAAEREESFMKKQSNFSTWVEYYTIYYVILNNPPTLTMAEVRETMKKAFNAYKVIAFSSHLFKFKELSFADYNYDIHKNEKVFNISFISAKFNLPLLNKTDEAGNTVKYGNSIFFNIIKWKIYKVGEKVDNKSIDFYSIAMFTVGKWLGWEISKNETSIMYEGYRDPIDENGNYVEPRFSEYDLEKCYSSTWTEENGYFYYTILNSPSTLSMTDVQKTMAKALNSWTLVYTSFKFQELLPSSNYNKSDFNISFESPKHASRSIFGSTLEEGEAGQAIDGVAIYFNKDIKWRIYKVGEKVDNESTDFYSIAMFSIGQLHQWDTSKNETSIMYEGYKDPIDENGNYVEPTFSEKDLEYSAIWRQRAAESYYTEDEFLKDVEKKRKQKEEEKQRKTLGTQLKTKN